MKAIVYDKYGPPEMLKLRDVKRPTPGDKEVLIKVYATTATAADGMMRRGDTLMSRVILGFFKPRKRYQIMGIELSGKVEQIGSKVTRFKEGDRVFGFTGFSVGAYAQYSCMPQRGSLAAMPATLTYDEAAAMVDGATTALYFLRDKAGIKKGDKVLIIGASGSIGTAAVQLARYFGAEVSGVCSAQNSELVRSLGADKIIDYTSENFTQNGEQYDIIFDTIGKFSFGRCKNSLQRDGRYLPTVGGLGYYFWDLWTGLFCSKKLLFGMSVRKNAALQFVKERVESGELRPVIDRRYPLAQIAAAHRYVEQGHKKGNVVITVDHDVEC